MKVEGPHAVCEFCEGSGVQSEPDWCGCCYVSVECGHCEGSGVASPEYFDQWTKWHQGWWM